MNWGHKIIVVYGVFVAGMSFLAFKASQQNVELVTDDYYAKELVYQKKIDAVKRVASLSATINITSVNHQLTIIFPKDFIKKSIAGEVNMYCPSDEKKDKQELFNVTDSAVNIVIPQSYHGLQYVQVSWVVDGLNYYYEQKIII